MDDPFTQVHEALIGFVKSDPTMRSLVPNIVELRGADDSYTSVTVEELPRLILMPSEEFLMEVKDSHEAAIRAAWHWELGTGEKWPRSMLYKATWQLFRVLAPARTELQAGGAKELKWNGRPFVYDVTLASSQPVWGTRDRNKNSRGWVSLLTCIVLMHFARKDLPP